MNLKEISAGLNAVVATLRGKLETMYAGPRLKELAEHLTKHAHAEPAHVDSGALGNSMVVEDCAAVSIDKMFDAMPTYAIAQQDIPMGHMVHVTSGKAWDDGAAPETAPGYPRKPAPDLPDPRDLPPDGIAVPGGILQRETANGDKPTAEGDASPADDGGALARMKAVLKQAQKDAGVEGDDDTVA